MEASLDESDFSEMDDDTDNLVQDYLNDTRVESVQASRKNNDQAYTPEQLENITLYRNAVSLNRETEASYKKLEDSLIKMLAEVRKKLKESGEALKKQNMNTVNESGFNYLRCGKPYFKDKDNFTAPDNEDTIMMRQAQMYDFSQVCAVPGWTIKDKTELVNHLLEMSRDIKRKKLRSQISRIRRDGGDLIQIANLEKQINDLNKKTLAEIALPLDQEYDWELLANNMNRRHTDQEYQALWKLFFHPSINKSSWSKAEHQALQRIATAHNKQDWDSIAKELNTGRSCYQCFVYYRTNVIQGAPNRKWTNEEIEYLHRVVEYFREGTYISWGKVASAMDGRTKIQVYNKYSRMVEQRKGRFLEEEDIVLLNCHEKFKGDFKKMSQYLPGRSAVQLKTRFRILTKFRLSTTWSVQDDRKLIQIMANQDSGCNFSNATQYFPGKDRTNIRSRYNTLMKWMKTHPASDISMAPRRGARRLLHGHATLSLNDAITNLNKRIETEVNTKKKKKITPDSRESEIDDAIMATLINEIIKEESTKKPDQSEIGEDSDPSLLSDTSAENMNNLRNLLVFFNASLDKKKFDCSKYADIYPGLDDTVPAESCVKVKSYSKTKSLCTITVGDFPDIWGRRPKLGRSSYVLPPNYTTITGCKLLMKHFGTRSGQEDINLSLMQRRNVFLKQAIDTLKERFTALFMWPIMLSNEIPKLSDAPYVSPTPVVEKKKLPQSKGLMIPKVRKPKYVRKQKQTEQMEVGDGEIDEPERSKVDLEKISCSVRMPLTTELNSLNSSSDDTWWPLS